ncbi:MAG: hypothetical protein NVS4B6_25790 [Mycobacterium sp.]
MTFTAGCRIAVDLFTNTHPPHLPDPHPRTPAAHPEEEEHLLPLDPEHQPPVTDANANHKTPRVVTFDELRRYTNGTTGQLDGIYGVAWRPKGRKPIRPAAAANVATVCDA